MLIVQFVTMLVSLYARLREYTTVRILEIRLTNNTNVVPYSARPRLS